MKGFLSLITAALLLFLTPLSTLAASAPKPLEATITSSASTVAVGENVIITATTVKRGSECQDTWNNAIKQETVLDQETGCYVATAWFEASQPGTYVIEYEISETAGNSAVKFEAQASITIIVEGQEKKVIGAEIRNITFTPLPSGDVDACSYSGEGQVYALYSDNTAAAKGVVFFVFGPEETSKIITVKFKDNGIYYSFPVMVSR